jgi:hypothetical protein
MPLNQGKASVAKGYNPMKTIQLLLEAVFVLASASSVEAAAIFSGNAEISLQFSPASPSMTDRRLEVKIIADLGAVRTDGGAKPILNSFAMPVGFDPSYVRLISATAGEASGYLPASFAYTQPGFANGRGLVTVMNSRSGTQDPGTQVELGNLTFEIKRPGSAWFIAGSARTIHQGALAAVPADALNSLQSVTWADRSYKIDIGSGGESLPVLVCPSWLSLAGMYQGMAFLNEGTQPASIQLYGWGADGTLVQSPPAINPSPASSLPAGNQDARTTDEIFQPQNPTRAMNVDHGWIEVRADKPNISGFFMQGTSNTPGSAGKLDGIQMTYTPASRLIFPLVRDPNRTNEISLINPGSAAVSAAIRVIGPAGQELRSISASIPAHGVYSREITDATGTNGVYVDVQATGGKLVGVEKLSTIESLAALSGQDAELASTRLSGPQFASGMMAGLRLDTHIALVNPSSTSTNVVIRLLSDTGNEVAAPVSLTLAGGALISSEGWKLFGLPDPGTTSTFVSGSVVVESDQGLIGALTFGDPLGGKYLAALPLMSSAAAKREIYFGQVAVGVLGNVDFFTGLAMVNPSRTETASIDIELHDKNGNTLAKTTTPFSLGPASRTAQLVPQLIPGFPSSQFGGYIRLISNIEVNAYVMFGDNYYNFLSAVP